MKYVVYFRVSTKKQGESGLGLEAQRTYVDHFYSGRNIIAEFTEKVSGKDISNRPKLQEAIKLCKKENAVLVTAKIDRLSRNTEQALSIYRELDGRLESCDVPNLDKFTLTLFMAIADRERELIGVRTKAALDEKKKQVGEWRSASKPFASGSASEAGVKVVKERAKLNENNRRAAAMIKQLRNTQEPMSWSAIAKKLDQDGFKTSNGSGFQAVQVQRIYTRYHSEVG